jgi:hypothetical protein
MRSAAAVPYWVPRSSADELDTSMTRGLGMKTELLNCSGWAPVTQHLRLVISSTWLERMIHKLPLR